MNMEKIKFGKSRKVKTPTRGTKKSAGLDFYIPEFSEKDYYTIKAHSDILIPSGIHLVLPEDTVLIAENKSGVATRHKLIIGAKVVDEDYRGEVHLHLFNLSNKDVQLQPGEKLVQFLHLPILYSELEETSVTNIIGSDTERGQGGFGSTGIH